MISWPALRWRLVMALMISGLLPVVATAGEAACGRFAFEPCCCGGLAGVTATGRALKVVDLARVKINQPQPWTPATLRLGRSHRTEEPTSVA